MTTTLITGANKGLGYETARQLIELGHTVYLGARDPGRGRAAAASLDARFLPIDVTDDESVTTALATIAHAGDGLDVLVNNAAIAGGRIQPVDATAQDLERVYATNVFGLVRTTHAALPLLARSAAPVIVNVASGLGSMGVITDPARMEFAYPTLVYGSSKSAVVAIIVHYAKALPGMRINAVDPGYTATDLNENSGTQTVSEGAEVIVAMATIGLDGPTGGFFDRHGTMPW